MEPKPKTGYRSLNLPERIIDDIDTCPPGIDSAFWTAIPRTRKIQILTTLLKELATELDQDLTSRAEAIR